MNAIAVALLLGAAAPVWAGADSATPPPSGTAQPEQTPPAPPPAANDTPDDGKPAITKEEFASVFASGYDEYASLKGAELRGFEANFKAYQTDRANPDNVVWFRSKEEQFGETKRKLDLSNATEAYRRGERTANECGDGPTKNKNCRSVPQVPDPNNPPKNPPTRADLLADANRDGLKVNEPKAPIEDKARVKEAGPAVDKGMMELMRNAAFGGIAGAVVGIGLLPLLGPMGILLGAMLGAGIMVVGKKLAS